MKKVKIKMVATIAAQFMVGSEVEGIMVEGTFYVPLLPNVGGVLEDAPSATKPAKAVAKPAEVDDEEEDDTPPAKTTAKKPAESGASKKYTEEEMMSMETKDLEKICAKLDIDIPTEGKNTNKKLRLLILEAQEGAFEETKTTAKAGAKSKGGASDVVDILAGVDKGDIEEDDALKQLVALGGDKKAVTAKFKEFMDSPDVPIEKFQKALAELIFGEEEEAEEVEETKTAPKRGASKEKLVTEDELEVGQRVSVYWEDQEEWFPGKVKSINRKGTLIAYDDESEEFLDDNNTKIKLV